MHATGPYADDLLLALRIADQVDALTLAGFEQATFAVETKADLTPVTVVDREAEALVRALLATERPLDGFHGEESGLADGADGAATSRRWVVDPIDGTKSFIRNIPVWATLIALLDGDRAVVGVVSAPAMGKRWFAAAGSGSWAGANPASATKIRVSDRAELSQAMLSYSSLSHWEERGLLDHFLNLTRAVWRTRAYGDFWSYMMVAEGLVDVACEPELSLWDMAALVPIIEEAGGTMTSLDGSPAPFGADALASNGALHTEALSLLRAK